MKCRFYGNCSSYDKNSFSCNHGGGRYCGEFKSLQEDAEQEKWKTGVNLREWGECALVMAILILIGLMMFIMWFWKNGVWK